MILFYTVVTLCFAIQNNNDLRQILQRSDFVINSADKFIDDFRNTLKKSTTATEMFIQKEPPKLHKKEQIKRIHSIQKSPTNRKYIKSTQPLITSHEPMKITSLNQRITEFPYFTPILNVNEFTQTKDKCNPHAPSYGYYIPIVIPPKKMLRVSTCNKDTTVFTPISVTYNEQCLQVIQRKCRLWNGNIIEYLPKGNKGMEAIVRVGASNVKNATVRITVYTVPITEKNKLKLEQGHVMRGNVQQSTVKVTTKDGDIVPRIDFKNNTQTTHTSDNIISQPNHTIQLLEKDFHKMGGWFKVCIAILISILVLTVGVIIFGSFRESQLPEQYSPF
ncbi:hypothetical protein KM1_066020 [Entamoeba histolytica HM-3:IMSS]|uniref:Uncharacterized protein n=2 Tax=Entamoeba histolytica TaxID=5759 RepID=M2RYW9_ENTHI|nr:Hypothetical protein EHI5A_055190 [Entamoeba histolytica KU27]EMS11750.1 hypothetical protein KM1_066020 [Entamoeba histolytica HM-3:IMSS]